MKVTRLADGLWRWTASYPEDAPDRWEDEVACLYLETPEAVVLVDPLVPEDERERFFSALDRDVERAARPVAVVITLEDHERSAPELRGRYGAEVWAPAEEAPRMRAPVAQPFAPGERIVGGIETVGVGRGGEVALWIEPHRTLFVADAILGADDGLRRCPDSWLRDDLTPERFRELLSPLLELPVERVVPAHGEVVDADAAAKLRVAVAIET